jgi:hypothetical protein
MLALLKHWLKHIIFKIKSNESNEESEECLILIIIIIRN